MENSKEEVMDGSSIKPVSSLRAQFENLLSVNKSAAPATPRQRSPATADRLAMPEDNRRTDGRISLDMPREHMNRSTPSLADFGGVGTVTPRASTVRMPWSNPKPRPTSMVAFSPPRSPTRSPPKVTVQSPKSPPKTFDSPILSPRPSRPTSHAVLDSPSPAPPVPNGSRPYKISSRNPTPGADSRLVFPSGSPAVPTADPRKGDRPVASAPLCLPRSTEPENRKSHPSRTLQIPRRNL